MSKLKQYFYVILLVYSNIYFITSKEIPKPYVNDTAVNKTEKLKLNLTTSIIPSEGGGKMIIDHVLSSSSTPASTIEKTSTKNTTTISTAINAPIIAEANKSNNNGLMFETNHTSSTSTTTEIIKPVSEPEEIVGDSKVKPRKGVTFSEPSSISTNITDIKNNSATATSTTTNITATATSTNTKITATTTTTNTKSTTTTTTTKKPTIKVFIPHKPIVTISNDDDVPAKLPPKLFVNGKEILPKNYTNSPPKLITDNDPIYISRRTEKGPDYVLPIVLTILSVPLLAIIFTVVYKRGAEWWHHRHYRRMDFLIDGMYNN